jgi:pantetheine-phosphate adenylyltransferase
MARKVGVYAGSFNPVTNGHMDLIARARLLVDHLVIVVAYNADKPAEPFAIDERVELIARSMPDNPEGRRDGARDGDWASWKVDSLTGSLLVDYARRLGAKFMFRGMRAASDFDYEFNLHGINHRLARDIETVYLLASPNLLYVSSSMVREIAQNGGKVRAFVPPPVEIALNAKYRIIPGRPRRPAASPSPAPPSRGGSGRRRSSPRRRSSRP